MTAGLRLRVRRNGVGKRKSVFENGKTIREKVKNPVRSTARAKAIVEAALEKNESAVVEMMTKIRITTKIMVETVISVSLSRLLRVRHLMISTDSKTTAV